ncbi:MAG: hypothetical protein CIT01_07225 [Methanobacterium sp. BRmetb2]|nr:MAG: hypothetical protein CIT01_07225 [Methanobacterium sp. BRmetb2]
MKEESKIGLSNKILMLTLFLFILFAVDYTGFSLNIQIMNYPGMFMIMAFLDTLILSYVILNSKEYGFGLILRIFLVFYTLKTLLVGMEALYLTHILSWTVTQKLLINGAITAFIYSGAAVVVLSKTEKSDNSKAEKSKDDIKKSLKDFINFTGIVTTFGKIILAGGVWTLLYIIFGAFLFKDIALLINATTTLQYLNEFGQILPLSLIFQFLRGIVWVILSLPIIYTIKGGLAKRAAITGLVFSILMATTLLIPTQLPFFIQTAYFIELFFADFLFGVIVVIIFFFKRKKS